MLLRKTSWVAAATTAAWVCACGSGSVDREDAMNDPNSPGAPPPAAQVIEPKPAGGVTAANGFLPAGITGQDAVQAYQQWKEGYLEQCSADVYRVKTHGEKTVSEGIAYGMLLSAYHNEQDIFDGLWQYYKNNANGNGLMHWERVGCEGAPSGDNAASDAELDAAMALIKASCQWSNAGRFDYAKEATNLILKIEKLETARMPDGRLFVRPGDSFGGPQCVNYSYFAPGYYRVFAQYVPSRADFWNEVADTAYDLIAVAANPQTGLVPNWGNGDGTTPPTECTWYTEPEYYGWDAVRTPWRIATDYLWFGSPAAESYLNKLASWVKSNGGISSVKAVHALDGSAVVNYDSNPATGGLALTGIAVDQATSDDFLGYFQQNPDRGYFQESLRALYLLVASGTMTHSCEGVSYP